MDAVCGPQKVFIALLESCWAVLIAEIMGENGDAVNCSNDTNKTREQQE